MAGGTNVGNLHATLSLSQFEFNSGLRASETAAMQFANTVDVQSKRASASMSRIASGGIRGGGMAQMFTQGGYALQDFTSQLETRGIGGAIGAITNNVQMMGASFGPVAGATVAIGAAVAGQVLPPFLDWLNNTKQLALEAKAAEKAFGNISKLRLDVATMEVKGGAGAASKELEDTIEINARLKTTAGMEFTRQQNKVNAMRRELDSKSYVNIAGFRVGNWGEVGAEIRAMESELTTAEKTLDRRRERFEDIISESNAAQDKLNLIGPGSEAAKKEAELTANKAAEALHFESLKKRDDLERSLRSKSLENYGTELEKVDARIEMERKAAAGLRISDEAQQRFNAMAAVDRQKAMISDAEKALSEMGSAAGSSAGVKRGSVESIQAINRAAAGSKSDQSVATQSLNIQKQMLKQLEQAARKPQPIKMVALSG